MVLAALVGYLTGAISFARVVTRWVAPGQDLNDAPVPVTLGKPEGPRFAMSHVSSTSVRLRLGKGYGCLTGLLDIAKTALPALAFRMAFPDGPYHLVVAIAGTIGHNWPVYYLFRQGGYGISPIYGGILVADWPGAIVASVVTTLVGVTTRNMFMAGLLGVSALIPWWALYARRLDLVLFAVAATGLYAVRALPDLRQTIIHQRAQKKST